MLTSHITQKASTHLHFILLSSLFLAVLTLSACTSTPTTTAYPTSSPATASVGDTSYIVVGPRPEIIVKSVSAAQLTFTASDTQKNISTSGFSLPYTKQGNKVTIDFGEAVVQPLEIKIPREASLSITLGSGNIVVNSLQGQIAMTLTNGTIHLKNFTPLETNTITAKSGTIDVSFAHNAAFRLRLKQNLVQLSPTIQLLTSREVACRMKLQEPLGMPPEPQSTSQETMVLSPLALRIISL